PARRVLLRTGPDAGVRRMKLPDRSTGSTRLPPATLAAWRAFADTMLHAAWLVQAADVPRVVAANDAAAALLQLELSALVGCAALELLASPEDQAFWREATDAAAPDAAVEIDSDT